MREPSKADEPTAYGEHVDLVTSDNTCAPSDDALVRELYTVAASIERDGMTSTARLLRRAAQRILGRNE